jgi:hypothetical protein
MPTIKQGLDNRLPQGHQLLAGCRLPQTLHKSTVVEAAACYIACETLCWISHFGLLPVLEHAVAMYLEDRHVPSGHPSIHCAQETQL